MQTDALFEPGGFARDYVRHAARRLVGRAGLTEQDVPDLCQELSAAVWAGLGGYDPASGSVEAFVAVLAERAAAGLLRHRSAGRRAGGWAVPIPGPAPRPDPDLDRTADLRIDLRDAVANLPPKLRETLAAVERSATAAGAARELGVSRSTLARRVRDARGRLEPSGIGGYAEKSCDTFGADCEGSYSGGDTPRGGER